MQIGITGGIGSGKSIVCKIFSILGIPIYDADSRARQLMETYPVLQKQIIKEFGKQSYTESGELNRAYLASRVFPYQQNLDKLNQMVHPAVASDYKQWVKNNENGNSYLIKEAALLIESGSYLELDYVVTVSAPESLRIKRVMNRDPHRDLKQIKSIIAKQLPESELISKSDHVLHNDDKRPLIQQVLKLHHQLIK
ncbi:MAG: dephospho-CoA kinase [Cyclobacteriaceae bacterium]|nr:MAG: dephospho-CoA kinase [Cyclobacteriaceae bacterium]